MDDADKISVSTGSDSDPMDDSDELQVADPMDDVVESFGKMAAGWFLNSNFTHSLPLIRLENSQARNIFGL
jgi:hypothetical protein